MKYFIFTDGACKNNPGPGGWGLVIARDDVPNKFTEKSGGERHTTNNRMELIAVIRALEEIPKGSEAHVVTDSKYVVDGINKGWAKSWRSRGWRKADNKEALNPDLWGSLLDLIDSHASVSFDWVKGHAGHPANEYCDKLATEAAAKEALAL